MKITNALETNFLVKYVLKTLRIFAVMFLRSEFMSRLDSNTCFIN